METAPLIQILLGVISGLLTLLLGSLGFAWRNLNKEMATMGREMHNLRNAIFVLVSHMEKDKPGTLVNTMRELLHNGHARRES